MAKEIRIMPEPTLSPKQNTTEGYYTKKAASALFNGYHPVVSLAFSRRDFFIEGPKYVEGMSISGVQQKLSLVLNKNNELEIVSIGGEYILKPSPESFPFASENEQCAMALSRLAGINTAASAIVKFSTGENAYITRRYDRMEGRKLHQEDLSQGFNIPSTEKYSKSYEEALLLVHEMSGGKLSVVRDLLNRIVFAYLIGNDDMHLKNISLMKTDNNRTIYYDSLTPNYDQLFAQSFENKLVIGFLVLDLLKDENDGIFTKMYEKYGFYTGSDFLLLGRRAGLPDPAINSIFNNYFSKEQEMLSMINRSFMPDDMKVRATSKIKDRLKAIKIIK
ncbi:MAG: HipA domain-containing protein [Spirochaetales bacterium]|nr:HipA domain-containing protein [Spirochaetales bacterium]